MGYCLAVDALCMFIIFLVSYKIYLHTICSYPTSPYNSVCLAFWLGNPKNDRPRRYRCAIEDIQGADIGCLLLYTKSVLHKRRKPCEDDDDRTRGEIHSFPGEDLALVWGCRTWAANYAMPFWHGNCSPPFVLCVYKRWQQKDVIQTWYNIGISGEQPLSSVQLTFDMIVRLLVLCSYFFLST